MTLLPASSHTKSGHVRGPLVLSVVRLACLLPFVTVQFTTSLLRYGSRDPYRNRITGRSTSHWIRCSQKPTLLAVRVCAHKPASQSVSTKLLMRARQMRMPDGRLGRPGHLPSLRSRLNIARQSQSRRGCIRKRRTESRYPKTVKRKFDIQKTRSNARDTKQRMPKVSTSKVVADSPPSEGVV